MINEACHLIFMMAAGHAFADFALQNPFHSGAKMPNNPYGYPWQIALSCHALIHGGIVSLITGLWWLGAAETVAHAFIDFGKGRGWWSDTSDQVAHIACKFIWMIIAINC